MKKHARLGHAGYVGCLAVIAFGRGEATWHDVAKKMDVERMTALRVLHVFNDLRLIHVSGWTSKAGDARNRTACYALGDAPDVAPACGAPRPRRNKRADSIELLMFASLIRAVQAAPHNGVTLHKETGVSLRAGRSFLKALHAHRLGYIAEYEDRGSAGAGFPLYAWGPRKRDAVKPAPIPAKELERYWNEVRNQRRAAAKLLRGMVAGYSDRRSSTYRELKAAAQAAQHEPAGMPA